MSEEPTIKVFVYGTLLQGLERHDALTQSDYLGPALVRADLFDLGSYPGIHEGANEVVGEVYKVAAGTLALLDQIEGYDENQPEESLFLRECVTVRFFAGGEEVEALAYFHGGPIECDKAIGHGDYRRHRLEQQGGRRWIIAFGSNLSGPRLEQRVGTWPEHRVGWLWGYELAFNKSGDTGNVFANCRFSGSGFCPAVAYALTPEQVRQLDPYEAGYLRVGIAFETSQGRQLAQVYLAHPDNVEPERLPGSGYRAHLEAGYTEHDLDRQCLEGALERADR